MVWHSLLFLGHLASGLQDRVQHMLSEAQEETINNRSIDHDITAQLVHSEFAGVITAITDHRQEITGKFISLMSERGRQYLQNLLVCERVYAGWDGMG